MIMGRGRRENCGRNDDLGLKDKWGCQKKGKCLSIFFTVAVILWMAVIFWFSAQPADVSTEMSESIGRRIGSLLVSGFDTWEPEQQLAFADRIDFAVRKCAHATEYAVLAGLLLGMFASYGLRGSRLIAIAMVMTLFYAMTDELHQMFVPGRACMVRDVLIDGGGGAAMCLLYALLCRAAALRG